MASTTRWWIAAPLALGLVVAACSDDGDGAATPAPSDAAPVSTEAPAADPTAAAEPAENGPDDSAGNATGVLILGDVEIPVGNLRCFFEEQPRAGLGGVYTHVAQTSGTNAAGDSVILDMSRARGEDGTVGDDLLIDIGDPGSEDAISLSARGPEGLIEFGEASAAAVDVEVTDFESEPVTVSFDLSCG